MMIGLGRRFGLIRRSLGDGCTVLDLSVGISLALLMAILGTQNSLKTTSFAKRNGFPG